MPPQNEPAVSGPASVRGSVDVSAADASSLAVSATAQSDAGLAVSATAD